MNQLPVRGRRPSTMPPRPRCPPPPPVNGYGAGRGTALTPRGRTAAWGRGARVQPPPPPPLTAPPPAGPALKLFAAL